MALYPKIGDLDLTTAHGRAMKGARTIQAWGRSIDVLRRLHPTALPENAPEILRAARLDRLQSLCTCIERWVDQPPPGPAAEAHLLLGWVNLGAIIEGAMRLFLVVYAGQYVKDPEARRRAGQADPIPAHELDFERLRQFFARRIFNGPWQPERDETFNQLIDTVQRQRNAIHQVDPRKGELADHTLFLEALASTGEMVDRLETSMPRAD